MSLQATATRLIAKNGRSVLLRKFADDPDSARPWSEDVGPSVDVAVDAVFFDYDEKELDGIVQRGDQKVLVSGEVSSVSEKDKVIDGSNEWRIMNVEKTQPGDTIFLYELRVRR